MVLQVRHRMFGSQPLFVLGRYFVCSKEHGRARTLIVPVMFALLIEVTIDCRSRIFTCRTREIPAADQVFWHRKFEFAANPLTYLPFEFAGTSRNSFLRFEAGKQSDFRVVGIRFKNMNPVTFADLFDG